MKAATILILGAVIGIFSLGVVVLPAQGGEPKPPIAKPQPPDLTVQVTLHKQKHTNAKGVTCYSLQPIYTVTNKGMSTAKGFKVKVEWKWQGHPQWQACSFVGPESLGPGKSKTWGPSPVEETHWCAGDTVKAGFRVTADFESKVAEKDETNNTAVALFPTFHYKKIN